MSYTFLKATGIEPVTLTIYDNKICSFSKVFYSSHLFICVAINIYIYIHTTLHTFRPKNIYIAINAHFDLWIMIPHRNNLYMVIIFYDVDIINKTQFCNIFNMFPSSPFRKSTLWHSTPQILSSILCDYSISPASEMLWKKLGKIYMKVLI